MEEFAGEEGRSSEKKKDVEMGGVDFGEQFSSNSSWMGRICYCLWAYWLPRRPTFLYGVNEAFFAYNGGRIMILTYIYIYI